MLRVLSSCYLISDLVEESVKCLAVSMFLLFDPFLVVVSVQEVSDCGC